MPLPIHDFWCVCVLQPSIEMLWAVKAYEHAEIYFNVSL